MTAPLPVTGPAAEKALRAHFTILVTDPNLNVLGDPLHEWSSLQATIKWKEPGSGQVVIPAYRYVLEQLVPGCRIVIIRRVLGQSKVLIGGPMEQMLRERGDDGENGGVGKVTVTFADDLSSLATRLTYPNPALLPQDQTTDYWTYSGNPEQGMLTLVNTQCGPGARSERRIPKLTVAPFSGISGTGTVALGPTSDVNPRERLEHVTDVLRKICTLGVGAGQHPDSLGFRVRQTQTNGQDVLLFEPVRSRNLAGDVHFSLAMGNLKYFAYELSAPTLTTAIVGGQGDGADRFVVEMNNTDPKATVWGRMEGYVPQPGTATNLERIDAARQAWAEGGPTVRLASNAADTVDQRYGAHYDVGDIVSLDLGQGETVSAPVQTVSLQAWPTAGEVVGTTIGDQSAVYETPWNKAQRILDTRVGRIVRLLNRAPTTT
ncbi:Gp37-like protein [Actinoplanes sp. URMC 104]|uniref:Gp37-like protein n=1 Tax=Actinoplanes sp. URMC 104 TaxID=3423409 RepID=UPI003F1A242D